MSDPIFLTPEAILNQLDQLSDLLINESEASRLISLTLKTELEKRLQELQTVSGRLELSQTQVSELQLSLDLSRLALSNLGESLSSALKKATRWDREVRIWKAVAFTCGGALALDITYKVLAHLKILPELDWL